MHLHRHAHGAEEALVAAPVVADDAIYIFIYIHIYIYMYVNIMYIYTIYICTFIAMHMARKKRWWQPQ